MCWLYSVPNLLLIQQLEILYLGGNNVRVVCERVWRIDQVYAIKSLLATGTRDWLASGDSLESNTRVKHAESWRATIARSLQDKKYSLAILLFGDWNSRFVPVASDLPKPFVLQKNYFSHSFTYPTINTIIPMKCTELLERILSDKP